MTEAQDKIVAEAAQWHVASHGEDMDWQAFTRWLEADERHRAAYDEVALADAALVESRAVIEPAFAEVGEGGLAVKSSRRRWLGFAGTAIAASLVAVVAFHAFGHRGVEIYETGAQSRDIALADGSSVRLAPHSRLQLAEAGIDLALEGGAWFDIRHDPSRRLSISAAGLEIIDLGTKFDVQAAAGQVRVEVAEGEVRISSAAMAAPVDLKQGRALSFDPDAGRAVVSPVAVANVGDWRNGRLSFDDAPLKLVAADLNRYAGVKLTVAESLADRHFTGTLVIGDGEAALRDLSQLMGLELGSVGDGYRLEPGTR